MNYYVYHLINPITESVFYVGKGKNNRMYYHEKMVRKNKYPNNNKHLYNVIKSIIESGKYVIYKKVYENLEELDAWDKEVEEQLRLNSLGIKLCNIAICGKGGDTLSYHPNKKIIFDKISKSRPKTLTDEWKENIRKGMLGKKHSDESKIKRSKKLTGKNNPMFGKRHSAETKLKIAKSSTGREVSNETREKCKLINLGRKRSDEFKLKVSKSKIGKKLSKETRVKMSESHKGVNFSEEHCKSISDSLKGRKFTDEHKNKLSDVAKKRTGDKNPNYKQLTKESELFILSNIDKPVYWIKNNLKENIPYKRLKNRITLLKDSNKT